MKKLKFLILGMFGLLVLAGCGSSSDSLEPIPFVPVARLGTYLVNADRTGGIGVYTVDPVVGTLTEVAGSPFPTNTGLNTVVVHPNGRFVYGGSNDSSLLEGFTLDPASGALTRITGFPIDSLADSSLLSDPTGENLYAFGETSIDGFRVNPVTGALTRLPNFPIAVPGLVESTTQAISRDGRYIYLADRGSDQIFTFERTFQTGYLVLRNTQSSQGVGPAGVGITPNGRFVYVANSDGTLAGFSVGNEGAITPLALGPVVYANGPSLTYQIAFIGEALYVGDGISRTLNAFSINNNGVLTGLPGFPRSGGGAGVLAYPFVFEDVLYASDGAGDAINAYTVSANGSLTTVNGSPFPGNGFPTKLDAAIVSF